VGVNRGGESGYFACRRHPHGALTAPFSVGSGAPSAVKAAGKLRKPLYL